MRSNALSFYSPIFFGRYKLFWLIPNNFGWIQIILFRFKLDFSEQNFVICTCPKWIGPIQNDLDSPKWFWTHRRSSHKELRKHPLNTLTILIYMKVLQIIFKFFGVHGRARGQKLVWYFYFSLSTYLLIYFIYLFFEDLCTSYFSFLSNFRYYSFLYQGLF